MTMDLRKYLRLAGVPDALHAEALASIELARRRSKGLLWHKIKVRYLRAGKIAKLIPWGADRLLSVRPDLASWDIAPMLNITASGDHFPWKETPEGGRPDPDAWINPDPESAEYQEAVNDPRSQRYFGGHHPRSRKAREMWYRRNAGEYAAWRVGEPVDTTLPVQRWAGESGSMRVEVVRCGGAWIINTTQRIVCKLQLEGRCGFEVDNIFTGIGGSQAWYPVPGHELRAPATWSTIPRWRK